jgi:hypothetical protein
MRCKASLQDMPKDLDRMRSGLAIKPSGPDAARCSDMLDIQKPDQKMVIPPSGCCWHNAKDCKQMYLLRKLSAHEGLIRCSTAVELLRRRTSTLVSCFILLRDLLAALPALAAALQPAQAALLCTMCSTFENRAFADMLAAVNEVIDEVGCGLVSGPAMFWSHASCMFRTSASCRHDSLLLLLLNSAVGFVQVQRQHLLGHMPQDVQASKAAFVNKTQQCFAVRGQVCCTRRAVIQSGSSFGSLIDLVILQWHTLLLRCDESHAQMHIGVGQVDGFLDLARSIFCRLTEQIQDMAESLRTELQLPSLKVLCNKAH